MHPLYGALALDLRHTGEPYYVGDPKIIWADHSSSRIHAVPLPLEEL